MSGEPGLVPTAPAIANAIYDAVGVRVETQDMHIGMKNFLENGPQAKAEFAHC